MTSFVVYPLGARWALSHPVQQSVYISTNKSTLWEQLPPLSITELLLALLDCDTSQKVASDLSRY